jgi:hypothetical protein
LSDWKRLKQREIAAAHGVTSRTVRKWTGSGMPRNRDGSYDLTNSIHWRLAHNGYPPGTWTHWTPDDGYDTEEEDLTCEQRSRN